MDSRPASFDPARGFEQTTQTVHKATYNTLVTLNETDISQIVPDLAQSWDVSPDAKTFTFHLRQGVKFQNSGNPMTSADVKWSIERGIAIKGNPSFLLDGITSVDAPDDFTVRVNKSDPDPHPLVALLFYDHPPIRERLAMGDG